MKNHIITRHWFLNAQYYVTMMVIALALLLFLPAGSWSAGGVIELPKTGQTKCYDATGAEISCAGTGQDGDIQAGVDWPNSRFFDNVNGTVTDNLTGLIWIKAETELMNWQAALDYVKTLNTGSYIDWRLPNANELRSLVDYSQKNPSLTQGHPFADAMPFGYWSSTNLATFTGAAWGVIFDAGQVGYNIKSYSTYVRAVRGSQCRTLVDSVICLPKTGQTKCYDAAGAEIQCSGTRQDGDIQAGVAWPNPRFVDQGDGTVTDNLAGLMWVKAEAQPMNWQDALDYVKTLNTGGHTDWRLPNVNELRSLVDYSQKNPSLPQGHPFANVMHVTYWSSTTFANSTNDAWGVNFYEGTELGYGKDEYTANVRAVRGGQSGSHESSTTTTSVMAGTTTTANITTTTSTASTECAIESIQPAMISVGFGLMPRITKITITMNVDLEAAGISPEDLSFEDTPRGIFIVEGSVKISGKDISAIVLFWGVKPGTYNVDLGDCGSIPLIISRF